MAELVEWLHTYNNTIILVEQIFATLLLTVLLLRFSVMSEETTTAECG